MCPAALWVSYEEYHMPAINAPVNSTNCAGLAAVLQSHSRKYKAPGKSIVPFACVSPLLSFSKIFSCKREHSHSHRGKFQQYQISRHTGPKV